MNDGSQGSTRSAVPPARLVVYGCEPDEAALFREVARRHHVSVQLTARPADRASAALAAETRCISVNHKTPIPNAALVALSEAGVRYLSTRSSGLDHIDAEFARSVGITVAGVTYSPDSVADYTLMLILMSIRDARSTVLRAQEHDFRLSGVRGRELRDLTVGVVGTGRIGAAVVERLRGFGCRVLAHDHTSKTSARYVDLDSLLAHSDVVTLHTPLRADTTHLLDRRRIDRMKRGALVINTGRGALIDTDALLAALESGRLGGAALDVVEGEESLFYRDRTGVPVGSDVIRCLQQLPNVLITPHTAFSTDHALLDIVEQTVANCLDFERSIRA